MDAPSAWLRDYIRDVPDFPEPGVTFKDITPLLSDADAFRYAVEAIADFFVGTDLDAIVGIDARGFIFGAPVACRLGCGFVPVRKSGKLPGDVRTIEYELEYGTNSLELRADGLAADARVAIVDDVLATGGTVGATIALCEQSGAEVIGAGFLIELDFLEGHKQLGHHQRHVLLNYA